MGGGGGGGAAPQSHSPLHKAALLLGDAENPRQWGNAGSRQEGAERGHTAPSHPLAAAPGCNCCGLSRISARVLLRGGCALLGVLIVLVLVAVTVRQSCSVPPRPPFSRVCPNGWVGFQGKCHYFLVNESDWNSSREHCAELGASLATIDSAEERAFMMHYAHGAVYWIGLHRAEVDAPWMCTNGTAFPNRFEVQGGGRCAYVNGDRVSSSLCHTRKRWVCSRADDFVLWKQRAFPA